MIEVTLPPLRQRRARHPAAGRAPAAFFARQAGKPVAGFTAEARAALARYPWPGNVRELRNAVERGVILAAGPMVGLARPAGAGRRDARRRASKSAAAVTLTSWRPSTSAACSRATPTLEEAAAVLGIDPSTLYRKRKRYGL